MTRFLSRLLAALALVLFAAPALAQNYSVANHAIPLGRGTNVGAFNAIAAAANTKFLVGGGTSADPVMATMSGDCSQAAGVVTCAKANGVSMPSSGTSGGVPYYSSTSAVGSSAALAANQIVLGGGSGTAPATLGSLGTATTLLHGNASGAPTFGSVVSGDLNITGTTCTNQFVSAISSAAAGTCTTDTLAGAQHANQGTTTTVLHGNAAGNPSWGSVAISTDVSGLGTGIATALGTNTGSAGAPVLFNGAGGTPSSLTLTNATGLPVSGITSSTSIALGVGSVELGNASDTTLSRSAAGQLAVEGVDVLTTSNTKTVSNKTLASPVITGTQDVQQALTWSGDISPTQITASQNDYAPTGFSTATTLRLDLDADHSITGLAGGSDGRIVIIHNISSHTLTLTNQDSGSTAANRFLLGGDVALSPDTSVTLRYDATSSRWRAIASAGSGGGGGGSGTVTSATIAAGTGISTSGTCTITTSGTCTVSLADQQRQNSLLNCAGIAKALAAYQRTLETFCDGYKASDGINSGSSSNYTLNTISGYVGPAPGGIDGNVQLMLHMDGSNGSTTFTDSSSNALTVTANGNAQISTAQSEFGGTSGLYDGTGDYLSIADNALLEPGSNDFTIDMWVRPSIVNSGNRTLISKRASSAGYAPLNLYINAGGQLAFLNSTSGSAWVLNINSGAVTFTANTWYHVALVRSGTTFTGYINGTSVFSGTTSGALYNDSDPWTIGRDNTGNDFAGNIDEFRYSVGVARWTTNFTPPTQAYSTGPLNATIVTTSQTADTTVSNARALLEIDPIDSITLNTDLTVDVTCNGGTNWASGTLSSVGKGQAGRTVVETADTSCGANTGTSFAARIQTLNNKSVNVYKTAIVVH